MFHQIKKMRERKFTIHVDPDDIKKAFQGLSDGKNIVNIPIGEFRDMGFQIEPSKGFEHEDYEKSDYVNSLKRDASVWFEKFPNCCNSCKQYSLQTWFKKEDFAHIPEKILNTTIYSCWHIVNNLDKENWHREITDYLETSLFSFGSPNFGTHIYILYMKHYIENYTPIDVDFPSDKRKQLIEFFNKPSAKEYINNDLDQLYKMFQNWISYFPDLYFFKALKEKYYKKIPLQMVMYDPEYNKYLGLYRYTSRTEEELIEILVNNTKELLNKIKSDELLKNKLISDVDKHKLDILNEDHRIRQKRLLDDLRSGEKKYVNLIQEWLTNEKNYFKDVSETLADLDNTKEHLINQIFEETIKISNKLDNQSEHLSQALVKLNTSIDNIENKTHSIIEQLTYSDIQQLEKDWNDELFKSSIQKTLSEIANINESDKENILKSINTPQENISVTHKLKLVIPLLFLWYEGNVELKSNAKFPRTWPEIRNLFIKEDGT